MAREARPQRNQIESIIKGMLRNVSAAKRVHAVQHQKIRVAANAGQGFLSAITLSACYPRSPNEEMGFVTTLAPRRIPTRHNRSPAAHRRGKLRLTEMPIGSYR
jgi:hypothetical protein